METTTTAMLIARYLETFQASSSRTRLLDLLDDEVFEVLVGVPWVRQGLAEFSPTLGIEDQRDVLFGLRSMAA